MKFSIIIPAYNSANFINSPLNSLENQTFKDFEVLIIDDGSNDNTKEVVERFVKRNKNWKYIKKQNGNWGSVINYVKKNKLAQGEYITILDSDDYYKSNILQEVSKHDQDMIITNIYFDENNKVMPQKIYFKKFSGLIKPKKRHSPLSVPQGKFIKKELFYSSPNLKEKVSYQDMILINFCLNKAKNVYYIKQPLAYWWIDRDGNSTNAPWDKERVSLWLNTLETLRDMENMNPEINSYILMYLWDLNNHFKGSVTRKINLNTSKARFKWLPLGTRCMTKIYFKTKTKKWINKK